MPLDVAALSQQVGAALIERGKTVCAAESCTGGLILSRLTDCAGSSAYVAGGVVSYSNEAKMRLLSVTGVAGPGGGSAEKPVGLTFIGLAGPQGSLQVERYVWPGDRLENKAASVEAALNLLLGALAD